MATGIVQDNLNKDKNVLGKEWLATYGSYFSDEENIQIFVDAVKPHLPYKNLDILYLASASGLLGERLTENLDGNNSLTIVDVSQIHLDENKNPKTTKICVDWLEMNLHKQFDIIMLRSSLDYFPTRELQIKALTIVKNHLKPDGIFINQPAYIPTLEERDIISKAYNCTGKIGQRLFQSADIVDLYYEAGFDTPKRIGEGKLMKITEQDHIKRYQIGSDDIKAIQEILKFAKSSGFVTETGYELDFEFPIFISKI